MKMPVYRRLVKSILVIGLILGEYVYAGDPESAAKVTEVLRVPEMSAALLGLAGVAMLVLRRKR
ncbi:MAG: hypothetical protein OSA84_08120 [Akkermansiaceae bacterium]|nr:hypothetical protein [Akkermansiaceae bacterium]